MNAKSKGYLHLPRLLLDSLWMGGGIGWMCWVTLQRDGLFPLAGVYPLLSSACRSPDSLQAAWPGSLGLCGAGCGPGRVHGDGMLRDAPGLPFCAGCWDCTRYWIGASTELRLHQKLQVWDPSTAARLLSLYGPLLPCGHTH